MQNLRESCDQCYQFGIVSTKLSDLQKGLSVAFIVLTGLLGWGGTELYKMNATLSNIPMIEYRVTAIENMLAYKQKEVTLAEETER